ncbi:MAG: arsenosugar biosynthesis radical SAM protein ArsS [Spirochaetes bacterium]|nr:arsenosugar biosynthesis radical SAM protein ArsS [Spirochaetota bacterium]
MNQVEQLKVLDNAIIYENFENRLKMSDYFPLKACTIDILQINVSKRCNLSCKHCHVEAGPDRKEVMSKAVLSRCLEILQKFPCIGTVDITGGSPETNSHLEWFIEKTSGLEKRLIVRSNLVILLEKDFKKYTDIYSENRVEIIGSLPDYRPEKADRQRGEGSFEKCITALKLLNSKGYGKKGTGLVINLVHNPAGAYLPGSKAALEYEYKTRLEKEYGVFFNNLFCLVNMPVGRYLKFLLRTDNYNDYLQELHNSYNPANVNNVMCRVPISVGWDGRLYDCDFNQMLGLTISDPEIQYIDDFDMEKLSSRKIVIRNHCYGCTAGAGSSCQGSLE